MLASVADRKMKQSTILLLIHVPVAFISATHMTYHAANRAGYQRPSTY